jgi:hypothetical protein
MNRSIPGTVVLGVALLSHGLLPGAQAQDSSVNPERLSAFERRIQDLEEALLASGDGAAGTTEALWFPEDSLGDEASRFRISGNADVYYLFGEANSLAPDGRFTFENARIFADVDLGQGWDLGENPAFKSASLYFEWDFYREGALKNKAGSLYFRADELLGHEALNVKIGRFPIPFGEEYLRYSEERADNPLVTHSVPSLYGWDEGFLLFGDLDDEGTVDYQFAVQDGGDQLNANTQQALQLTAKLAARPSAWSYASLSALTSGDLGDAANPANSAFEWGGTHATPFGSGDYGASFQDGGVVVPDPSNELSMSAWELDVVLTPDWGRLWLAGGQIVIESGGDSSYDRTLAFGIAEAVMELGWISDALDPMYLAGRYSVMGTFDSDEGYLLEAMNGGGDLGFNTKSVSALSLGVGLPLSEVVTLKAEYAWYDFDLVDGVPGTLLDLAGQRDYFGIGFAIQF